MNLETITNVLVDNAEKFRERHSLDMSMFPIDEVPRIYAAAAEGTLRNRDFRATAQYLFSGKQWGRLLELGVPFFHSANEEEKTAGKYFLEILMCHYKLPKDTAIELADHILENDGEHYASRAAMALAAGNAKERADELANQFFNEGKLVDGLNFLNVAGKNLSTGVVDRLSDIALENKRPEEAFKLYESLQLVIPRDKAKKIADRGINHWILDSIIKYQDKSKTPFSSEEFRSFADAIFNSGNYENALKFYERAGDSISKEGYKSRGEQILSKVTEIESSITGWCPGKVWQSVRNAFEYLSKNDLNEAKKRLSQYADSLLYQSDFAKAGSNVEAFGKIYEMIELQIPFPQALKAAKVCEDKKSYGEAAKFYAAAGMKDAAKRMGDSALKSNNNWEKKYGSSEAFNAVGDKDGLAVVKFIEKNLRD